MQTSSALTSENRARLDDMIATCVTCLLTLNAMAFRA